MAEGEIAAALGAKVVVATKGHWRGSRGARRAMAGTGQGGGGGGCGPARSGQIRGQGGGLGRRLSSRTGAWSRAAAMQVSRRRWGRGRGADELAPARVQRSKAWLPSTWTRRGGAAAPADDDGVLRWHAGSMEKGLARGTRQQGGAAMAGPDGSGRGGAGGRREAEEERLSGLLIPACGGARERVEGGRDEGDRAGLRAREVGIGRSALPWQRDQDEDEGGWRRWRKDREMGIDRGGLGLRAGGRLGLGLGGSAWLLGLGRPRWPGPAATSRPSYGCSPSSPFSQKQKMSKRKKEKKGR